MNEASSIIIPDASALTVDTSCIDVSEVELQEDKDFLLEKGENILRIVAHAALAVGQQLVEIQENFKTADNPKGYGLTKFYESIGITQGQASKWSNKYRAFKAYEELFGGEDSTEKFNKLGDNVSSAIWGLPAAYREAFLADIAIGELPSSDEVAKVSKRPEVKLSKAEELLAAARARKATADDEWELVKADPDIGSRSSEYQSAANAVRTADISIANFEQQIADLKAQIEEEKLKTAEQAELAKICEADKASMEKELQKLKFDDAQVRAERIKKLSTTLTVSIPQTLADVSKFFAEIDHYPEEVKKHVYANAKILADTIGDNL